MKKLFSRPLSLSSLMILLVSGVAVVIVLLSTTIYTTLYTNALRTNAATSSQQSVAQAAEAITDYTSDANTLLRRISGELQSTADEDALAETFSTMVQMRDDLTSIGVYSENGVLLDCWTSGRTRKFTVGTLDFRETTPDASGLYYAPPHVQNLYADYYPWVVTIARQTTIDRYGGNVYVSMDLQFSSIASYMDAVGIGQHGYSFIIDSKGRLIYHPQQQLIYAGLKTEDTAPLAILPDGVHMDQDVIRIIHSLPQGDWRIVGISFLEELVRQPQRHSMQTIFLVVSAALFILLGVALLIARLVSRPIHSLVEEIHDFENAAPDFVYTPVSGTAEIRVLSNSFAHMVSRIQHLVDEVKNEEEILRKTELKALQAQINPHFLYNTLDSIQWMCEVGRTQDAIQMVSALARLFRISISRGEDLIPIRKELEHAKCYLIIQKFRYKDQFSYHFDVDECVLDCLCSKITLQPILENAILHGFGEFVEDGELTISVRAVGQDIEMIVTDNGIGMEQSQCESILAHDRSGPSGIGIKNVADRIRIYFGAAYGLTIESEPDQGTRVIIRLPQSGGNAHENP